MNGMQVEVDKKHTLTPDVGSRIASEGADLGELYIAPTPEEIAQIVSGNAKTLEDVFAKYRKSNSGDGNQGSDDDDTYSSSVPSSSGQSAAAQQAQVQAQTLTTAVETKTEVAPAPVQQQAAQATTAAPTQDFSQMSNDDFLKSMGL